MMPFDTLAELFAIATEPFSRVPWSSGKPPTARSIEKIQRKLGIRIPEDYVQLATTCSSYAACLAGIGEDYESGRHIIGLNRLFHDTVLERVYGGSGVALPSHFILLNHGHDGDCDCWDIRERTASGEHPIIHVSIESSRPELVQNRFDSFRAYVEDFVVTNAPRHPKPGVRRKAKRMIQGLGGVRPT
jgi:hypothetical protein